MPCSRAGSTLGLALGITLLGTLVTLPQYVPRVARLHGDAFGRAHPVPRIVMLLTPPSMRLTSSGRVDPRWQIGVGFALIGVSNWLPADVTTFGSGFRTFLGGVESPAARRTVPLDAPPRTTHHAHS